MKDEEYISEELHAIKNELDLLERRFLRIIKFTYKGNESLTESNEDRVRALNFLLKGNETSKNNISDYSIDDLTYLNIDLYDK